MHENPVDPGEEPESAGFFVFKYFRKRTTENIVISQRISYNETIRVREDDNMITCRECGAQIDELAECCPYCGAINELGAEHKYMQDMYDLKDDLKDLGNIPKEEITEEVKSNVHFTGKTIAILLIVVLILAGVLLAFRFSGAAMDFLYSKVTNIRTADTREQMKWERENFPKLNAWYEEGDYDSILAFCNETDEAAGGISYSYTNWEHWNIVPFYDTYQECMELKQYIQQGEVTYLYEYQGALYDALTMNYDKKWFHQVNDKDETLVDGWIEETMQFVRDTYQMSDSEIRDLENQAEKDDFFDYKVIYKYVEEHKDRIPATD